MFEPHWYFMVNYGVIIQTIRREYFVIHNGIKFNPIKLFNLIKTKTNCKWNVKNNFVHDSISSSINCEVKKFKENVTL